MKMDLQVNGIHYSANPCLRTRGSHEPLYHSPGKEALLQHIQVMLLFSLDFNLKDHVFQFIPGLFHKK